ncbi:MAG TPA: DoxX family membrane protein, partial [Gemmatimonadales bacterium]|nr:DoxX family membrane protein [Gemmatimonadales bacterium]
MTTATYAERSAIPATPALSNRINAGLAFLRVVIGTIFIVHGAQKLFTIGLGNIGGMMAQS